MTGPPAPTPGLSLPTREGWAPSAWLPFVDLAPRILSLSQGLCAFTAGSSWAGAGGQMGEWIEALAMGLRRSVCRFGWKVGLVWPP